MATDRDHPGVPNPDEPQRRPEEPNPPADEPLSVGEFEETFANISHCLFEMMPFVQFLCCGVNC